MSNKKTLLILISSIVALIAVVIAVCFLFIKFRPNAEEGFKYSAEEKVVVQVSNKDIEYFVNVGFLNKKVENSYSHMRNVMTTTDNKVYMKNIILFETTGEYYVEMKDEKIIRSEFKSVSLNSAKDTDVVFKRICNKIATANNVNNASIYFVKNDNEVLYNSHEMLYDPEGYLQCMYEIDGVTVIAKSQYNNNAYQITVTYM